MTISNHCAAVALILMLDLITSSDETCWNDYQSGLDNAPGKAKEAGRVTATTFQCSIDMREVRSRLPNGDSCYEVGVRNGALWQLQALAVANQCSDVEFFSDHWMEETIPESLIKQGLRSVNQITNGATSNALKSLRKSLIPNPFQKSPEKGNTEDRPNGDHQERPWSNMNLADNLGRGTNPAPEQVREPEPPQQQPQDSITTGASLIESPISIPSLTQRQEDLQSVSQPSDRSISTDRLQSAPSLNGAVSADIRPIMTTATSSRLSPLTDPQPESTISSRKIIQQQERRVISTGSDTNMPRSNTASNSLLIPSQSTSSRSIDPTGMTQDPIDRGSRGLGGPEHEITVKTFESNSKTIV